MEGRKRDFPISETITGIFFTFFGLLFFWDARKISSGFMQVVGADVYPKTLALGMIICGILYLVKTFVSYKKDDGFQPLKSEFRHTWKKAGPKLVAMWVLLIAYVYFVRRVGYFETGFIFLSLSMFFLGERTFKWFISSIGISVLTTFVSYIVFVKLLNTYLPSGILFKM